MYLFKTNREKELGKQIANADESKKEELYVPYYDVISTNLSEDVRDIYEKLKSFNSNIKVVEYHPFFQFLDDFNSWRLA